MNTMRNTTGDLMASWMACGGTSALSSRAETVDGSVMLDAVVEAAAMSNGRDMLGRPLPDMEISAAQGSHQFRCAAS